MNKRPAATAGVFVYFRAAVPEAVLAKKALFRRAVVSALGGKAGGGEVNLVFVGGPEIKKLNAQFLGKNSLTDVIAFNYHPEKVLKSVNCTPPFGDIYVCVPQAKKQALKMGHGLATELLILAAHGALHLAGLDDATPPQRKTMNRRTALLLKQLL